MREARAGRDQRKSLHHADEIFIVYLRSEIRMASSFAKLLKCWSPSIYFCEQENQTAKEFRTDLQDKLANAKLVVILLSRGVKWSNYCQGEIGAASSQKSTSVVVVIPPVKEGEIVEIAPVLSGFRHVGVGDKSFLLKFKGQIEKGLGRRLPTDSKTRSKESECLDTIRRETRKVKRQYENTAPRILLRVWPGPALAPGQPAPHSMLRIINERLRVKEHLKLAIVGVSLKYSFRWLDRVFSGLGKPTKAGIQARPRRTLEIALVHMDDQSHILHALKSYAEDIGFIRKHFRRDWETTTNEWKTNCEKASIVLDVKPYCIDYLPPRVGVLIDYDEDDQNDDCALYAGRCAFSDKGGGFELLVGQLEYFHYLGRSDNKTEADIHRKAITEFKHALKVYRDPVYNTGIVLVGDSGEWLARLIDYLVWLPDIRNTVITIISESVQRCTDLIAIAVHLGAHVKVYMRNPDCLPPTNKEAGKTFGDRLVRKLRTSSASDQDGKVSVFYYQHASPYRAVLIDGVALGIQMYGPNLRGRTLLDLTAGGPLPLIILGSSSRFQDLKDKIITNVLNREDVQDVPAYTIVNGQIEISRAS